MKKAKTVTVYKDESRLFYIAVFTCVFSMVAYMYFVSTSVAYVVMRKEVDTNIVETYSKLSGLEAAYIERQHAVSNDIATRAGYVAAPNKVFVERGGDTLVLQRN